jgi:hypothetical protein
MYQQQLEVAEMPTKKVLRKLTKPLVKIMDTIQLRASVKTAVSQLRTMRRNDDTLARRISTATTTRDTKNAVMEKVLNPNLDAIFWRIYTHWDELKDGRAKEQVKLNDAVFKRHIDTLGTKTVVEEDVIAFIEGIDDDDTIIKLRQELGDQAVDELVTTIKGLVTYEVKPTLDTKALKALAKENPLLTVPGINITYTSTLTMVPNSTESEEKRGIRPQEITYIIPNP